MQPSRQKDDNAYLTCFLCEQSCVKPRLCPKCSKAFCEHCLLSTSTSSRSQCPSCSARLRVQDFLSTEVVMGVVDQVIVRVKREVRRNQQRELCIQHDMALSYFCIECNHPLCSDCGMLTNKHTGHKFVSYRDIYERIKRRILEELPRFDKKIKFFEDKKINIRNQLAKLNQQYRKDKYVLEENCYSYTQKIDAIYKARQEAVIAKEEINNGRLQQLEVLRDTIYEQMETKTHLSLIRQTDSLAESINALSSQQPPPLVPEPIVEADDMGELIPDYTTWRYTLTQFSTKSGIVYSQGKLVNGVEWRLKIYPKGNGLAREKYLSLFVEMSKGFTGQNKYQYRIELINPGKSFLTVRRQYCSTFQIGECWGYNQFEPLQNLVAKEYLINDQLMFQIGIRNRTYRALVNEQNQYIAILTRQLADKTRMEIEGLPKRGRNKELRKLTNVRKSPERENKQAQKKQISFEHSTLDRIKDYLLKQSKQN